MIGFRGGISGLLRIGSKRIQYTCNLISTILIGAEFSAKKKLSENFAKAPRDENAADNVLSSSEPETNNEENPRTRE